MRLYFYLIISILTNLSYERVYKQIISTRAVKYDKFHNVDYKIISLPLNLYDLTISIKFVKWIGFLPLCPKSINITTSMLYGTFPLFEHDTQFQKDIDYSENILISMIYSQKINITSRVSLKSPKHGSWFLGSIFNNTDKFEHFIICSAELRIEMTGLIIEPQMSVIVPKSMSPVSIPISVNDSHNLLIEIKSHEPLKRIKIELFSPSSNLIISTARNVVPEIRMLIDAKNHGEIFRSGDIVADILRSEFNLRLLLQIRAVYGSTMEAKLIIYHEQINNDENLVFLAPATNIKADALFTYRFSSPERVENLTIPIVLKNHNIVIQSFYIESIRDQGGILSIDIVISKANNSSFKNGSFYFCVGDTGFSSSQDIFFGVKKPGKCTKSNPLLGSTLIMNNTFYYPHWGWWYISMMVDSNDTDTEWTADLSISSRRCKAGHNWCNGNGICLLSAIDNGLVSSCHCFPPFYGLDCLKKRLRNISKIQLSIYKRNWLVLSNLAFIPTIIIATINEFYLLSILYAATAGFSMVYHMCSIDDMDIKSCLLPLDQLVFYDHFAAAFTIWASLVTLSTLSSKTQSILNCIMVFCFLVMAHSIQKSVWMYLVPVLGGLFIIFVCWSYRMYHLKCIFPPIDWWLFGLVPGLCLVSCAFVFFRLSIYEDYEYSLFHSIWHILIALSICFLLPNSTRWTKALKKTLTSDLIVNEMNTQSKRWRKFKKNINYYLHLDILIDYLVLHNPRCSVLKSY